MVQFVRRHTILKTTPAVVHRLPEHEGSIADGDGPVITASGLTRCFRPMSVSISESPHASPERRVLWIAKMLALVMAMTLAVASFSVCYWAISGELKANTVALASLVMLPALGIVPYLTLLLRSPYVAVLFASFLLGALKLAGCLLSRAVYGPNALADGYMAMSWDRPNLLVWFCLVVGLLCSGVFAFMGYRVFSCHTKGSVA